MKENKDSECAFEDDIDEVQHEVNKKFWKKIPGFGFLLILVGLITANFTNLLIKKMTSIDPLVLLFYRSILIFLVTMPWAVVKEKPPFPPGQSNADRLRLLYRGIIGTLNMWANFYSLRHMPLGDQKILVATRPIFVTIFARIFLKEPCGVVELVNMFLMLSGVVCVMKPPVIFGEMADDTTAQYDDEGLVAAVLVFITTILAGNITVILRTLRKDHVASLTATNQMIIIVFSFILIFTTGRELTTPSYEDRLLVLGVATGNVIFAVLQTLALKLEDANQISLVDNCGGIIMAFILQMAFTGEVPGLVTGIGAGLVTLAVIVCGMKKIVLQQCFKHSTK